MCSHAVHVLHVCRFNGSCDLAVDHMCFTYALYGSHLFKTFFLLTVDTLVILPFAIIIKFKEPNLRGFVGEGVC